jgi:hypothetical protein
VRVCVLIFISALFVSAQESVNFASVSGRVADPAGAVVQATAVLARHIQTNLTTVTTTDREGRFRFPYLRVGEYEIAVHHPGFAAAVRRLSLSAGAAFELPVTLAIEDSGTAVTIVGEAARTQLAETVPQSEIHSLPLNGRNFLDVALLIPGVSLTNTGTNQLFAETSAVPGQGISVASQRNFSNSFIVDGLSANDDAAGLSGMFYGVDTVDDFQVVTSGGQAELGRALGGYVNVVTKSGTNALHGSVYNYFRNQRLNAANPLSNTKLPLTQAQYGASLGGPVVRNRTFYFANFEQRLLNQSGLVTIAPANAETINTRLRASGYPGSAISTGLYPNPVHNESVFGKLDHQFSARSLFSTRYSVYRVHSENSRVAGALNAATASAGLENLDQTLAASDILTLSPRTVNETRGQFTYSNLQAPPSDPIGPAASIAGVASFGTQSGSPTGRLNRLYEFADNLSHQAGAHALRFGADFLYNDLTIAYPRSIRGSYSFSSLSNFLQGAYNNSGFTQTFGNSIVAQGNPNLGIYGQDEWKISSRLTLNLGVRYDLQFLETIATDTNNVAPRAGFAWSPTAARRTVIRGSFGLFYDRVPLRALANALLSASGQATVSLSPAQTGAPVFPAILAGAAVPPGILYNLTAMDPRMQNAYSAQGSFEVEQQLGSRSTLSIAYEHLRGLHLIASINRNAQTCAAAGNNNGCRPNPGFANIGQYSPAADSWYDGLHVSFVHRPGKWGSFRASYTYSKAMDDVGENFFSSPIDNSNIWRDYGRSDDDQRHRVVFHGNVHSPMTPGKDFWGKVGHGFQLSGILQYYSSFPLNITSGSNTIQGTAARPVVNGAFIDRNAGTGNDLFSLTTRISRMFAFGERVRLEAIAEAFNALNHRNNLSLNSNFGPGVYPTSPLPGFRQVTAVGDPRTAQLALRISF